MQLQVALFVFVLVGGPNAGAPTPSGRAGDVATPAEKVRIDDIPGKMGAVVMSHLTHARTYKAADFSAITCKACHHTLADTEPRPGEKVQRCKVCHAQPGQPERTIGGKNAVALARMKPDGALEPRSVLMHRGCVDGCHKRIKTTRRLYTCKTCHEKGITGEVLHGRFDE